MICTFLERYILTSSIAKEFHNTYPPQTIRKHSPFFIFWDNFQWPEWMPLKWAFNYIFCILLLLQLDFYSRNTHRSVERHSLIISNGNTTNTNRKTILIGIRRSIVSLRAPGQHSRECQHQGFSGQSCLRLRNSFLWSKATFRVQIVSHPFALTL